MRVKYILLFIISALCAVTVSIEPVTALLFSVVIASSTASLFILSGAKTCALNAAIMLVLSFVLYTNIAGVVIVGASVVCGVMIALSVMNKLNLQSIIGYSAGSFLLVIVIAILCGNFYYHTKVIDNFVNSVFEYIRAVYASFIDMAEVQAVISQHNMTTGSFWDAFDYAKSYIIVVIPSLLILTSAAIAYFSFCATRRAMSKEIMFLPVRPFLFLRMNRLSGWIFILAWSVPLFISNQMVVSVFDNILLVLMALFEFCGFSYVCYLVCRRVSSHAMRVVLITLISLFSIFLVSLVGNVYLIIGIVDSVWDLRKISVLIKKR